jgi:hypothetical protein
VRQNIFPAHELHGKGRVQEILSFQETVMPNSIILNTPKHRQIPSHRRYELPDFQTLVDAPLARCILHVGITFFHASQYQI